ncbi:hypothetical protein [Desulfatitalea alkaliphila]|uniref:Uncharacterized protein n=1 Tax=Desulfatitalea alkaliphila TaxID=2929485 RepID=A0AA41QZT7_9BACT|nr:hypothetical protein [Desulfatitalea alkaliphila]MCJ8500177.1 hypothetical protein [Desulfatitalea alkaliphila]
MTKTSHDPESDLEQRSQPIKPMHHLPRGKNTWNPKIIRQWWFWPAAAAALYVLYYVYPLVWDWLAG